MITKSTGLLAHSLRFTAGVLVSATCMTIQAQDDAETDANISYPADYFASFSPTTVNDMLDRIPGINLVLNGGGSTADGDRGLGSSSSILVDGKRLAGKSNEARDQLDRIPASQVVSIEIVRGTSSELDVQNRGQLVNIVLRESLSSLSVTSEINTTHFDDGTLEPGGSLAIRGQSGRLDYTVSGSISSGYQRMEGLEGSINGDFSPNDTIESVRLRDQTNYSLNSNLTFALTDRDRIAFNALFNMSDPPATLQRTITDHNSGSPVTSYEFERIPGSAEDWEIGGDYEHSFLSGSRFKALFIVNETSSETTRERFAYTDPAGPRTKNLYLDTGSRYRERIARSSYTRSINDAQGIEFGVEVAQTIQDSRLKLGVLTPAVGSAAFGGLTPVISPNDNSTVEEMRYEPFVIHNWTINPRMTLESTLVAEFSEIEQSGDIQNKRDFSFLKPKLDYRFNISSALQLRGTLEKVVSQLSFADFSRSTNPDDRDQDTRAGNPQLEPEESLRAEMGLDYRLPNDSGTLNSRLFYYDFDNKIGRIDISTSPTNLQSTNGNVGTGYATGLALNGTIRLGFLNLPSAMVTANVTVQRSRFDHDPFTTPIRHGFFPYDRGGYGLNFRHDVASMNLNYGFTFSARIRDNRFGYENDSRTYLPYPHRINTWVEKTGLWNLTYRLEANNVAEQDRCQQRRRYQGYIRDGVIREIENICTHIGPELVFRVRGNF